MQRSVDGHQVVVQPGQRRIVGEVHRVYLQHRVAVHELVELPGSQCKGGDHFSRLIVLPPVGDCTAFHERQETVADHFGVHAEVMLVRELHHHGVGDAAITDLQGRPIVDHVGHVLANGLLYRADFRQPDFQDGLLALDQRRHLRDMNTAVAECIRNVRVDFEHHRPGLRKGCHGVVGAQAQREIAILVHWRGHAEHHVGSDLSLLDLGRNFRKIVGNEIDPAGLPACPRGTTEKERNMTDMVRRGRIEIAVLAHRQDLAHLDIVQVQTLVRQRGQQCRRLTDTGRHDDEIPIAHDLDRPGSGGSFLLVSLLDRHALFLKVATGTMPVDEFTAKD